MAWSNTQKALAVRACESAGIRDEHRKLILQQIDRSIHEGRPTSSSPRLNQDDFEFFMSVVERNSGGQVQIRDKAGTVTQSYTPGYWQRKAETGPMDRLRHIARRINDTLEHQVPEWKVNGEGLSGWIRTRVTGGRHGDLQRLTYRELQDLVQGLRAFAKRRGVELMAA